MLEAEQVGARAGDEVEQLSHPAGAVGHPREQPYAPPLGGFAAAQDRREQTVVDVAAGDDGDGRSRDRRQAPAGERGDGDRAGALGHELAAFGEEHHRVGDLVLADRLQVAQQHAEQSQRDRAGPLQRDPVGDRRGRADAALAQALGLAERGGERRIGARLHADQLRARAGLAQGHADAAGQPAAADGHDHAREVGKVLKQLERDRPLTGDHVGVVERVDQRGARSRGVCRRQLQRLLDRRPAKPHARAEALDGRHLRDGGVLRHEDLTADARQPCRVGDGARVVARAGGDEAARRTLAEGGDLGQRPAQLERPGPLQRLGLQQHPAPGRLREVVTRDQRRAHGDRRDRRARRLQVDFARACGVRRRVRAGHVLRLVRLSYSGVV